MVDATNDTDGHRYDTVFWDIGGVILELSSVRRGYAAFVGELAMETGLDPDAALEEWKSTLGEHFHSGEENRYRSAGEGYRKATAALFEDGPPADWEAILERRATEMMRPVDGAVETIESLDDAGLTQAVVSDIDNREAERTLEGFGVRDRFAHVTTSEDVGYKKPDERMFRDAIEATGADPDRTVMVGDRYRNDIVGAAGVGLGTAGLGEDAWGSETDHRLEDIRELLSVLGVP